jgi:hypothetical protein
MVNGCAWFAPKMVWTLHNTWPTKATGTDVKSEGQRVAVESADIAVETLQVKAVCAISAAFRQKSGRKPVSSSQPEQLRAARSVAVFRTEPTHACG